MERGLVFMFCIFISVFLQNVGVTETTSSSATCSPYGSHTISSPPFRQPLNWKGSPVWSPAWAPSHFQFPSCSPSLLRNLFNSDNLHTVVLQCGLGCPRDWFETHKSISESLRWGHSGADSIFSYAHLNPAVLQGNKTLQIYCGAGEQNKGTFLGS